MASLHGLKLGSWKVVKIGANNSGIEVCCLTLISIYTKQWQQILPTTSENKESSRPLIDVCYLDSTFVTLVPIVDATDQHRTHIPCDWRCVRDVASDARLV